MEKLAIVMLIFLGFSAGIFALVVSLLGIQQLLCPATAEAHQLTVGVTVTDGPQILEPAQYHAGVGVSAAVNLTTENEKTTRLLEAKK
jgi:hypothetical protein